MTIADRGSRSPAPAPADAVESGAMHTPGVRVRVGMRILSRSRVFEVLPPEELERVAGRSVFRRLRRGEPLTRHGDRGNSLIVVGKGRLKVVLPSAEPGSEFLVGTFVAGDVIGEIRLFENVPRVGSHVAVIETEVLLVPKTELLALIDRRPVVAIRLLEAVAGKLRLAVELGQALHSLGLPGRFYGRLRDLSRSGSCREGDGLRINHGLSQRELADSIAASREALNRLMSAWKQSGFIDFGRGFVVIHDPEALAQALPSVVRPGEILGAPETGSPPEHPEPERSPP
jgi:CRP/FNR family cyclic AMP-dependent transcriptional regulator